MQILLVEDNLSLAQGLKVALSQEGFIVNVVHDGRHALDIIKTELPDLVVLDLGLPDLDGLTVLKSLKKINAQLPALVLTARDSIADKVTGLESGADDYLAKPFDMAELIARIRVIERRLLGTHDDTVTLRHVCLSLRHHQVLVHNEVIDVSRREYQLLKSLMESAGRVLTRHTLQSRIYDWEDEVASNALEVHIHNLRKKLGGDFIKTVRGVGYTVAKK